VYVKYQEHFVKNLYTQPHLHLYRLFDQIYATYYP